MSNKPPRILLVEDEDIDVKLIKKAFDQLDFEINLVVANNGEQALSLLRETQQAGRRRSGIDLVLLDINMPRMSGREFLSEVRHDPEFAKTVVVMLTSSEDENDVNACYALGANGYICKPLAPAAIKGALKTLLEFWFCVATLPTK